MSKQLGDAFVRVRPDTAGFTEEANHSLGGGLKKIATGVAAVFAAAKVKDFLKESTAGYRDHLKVTAITAQALKTTGGAANISAKAIGHLSDAIERKTGVDGDAIQSGQNLLLTFTNVANQTGKGNKIFTRASGLLADMSVALGQDAKGSAIQLGKALNDPIKGVTALSRVGVSFTEQQKKQIKTLVDSGNTLKAQKLILHELGKEFGGAAQAAANPADRARASYHQLQDMVGSVTVPVMNKLYKVFADKVAPILLRLGEKVLPQVRHALLSALNGIDFSRLTKSADSVKKIDLSHVASSVKGFANGLRGIDWSKLGKGAGDLSTAVHRLGPALKKLSVDTINKTLSVFSVVVGFAANHTGLLAKALPFLAGGFIAVKVAQAAANAAAVISLPTKIAEVVVNRQLVKSNRELVLARRAGTVATEEGSVVENVSILTRIRSAIATAATTVAQKAAAAASKAWAAAQWLLNAALTANPIGIVVAALVALGVGLVIAYKKSETFRNIVNGAFSAIKAVVGSVIGWIGKYIPQVWQFIVSAVRTYITVYRTIIVTVFNVVRAVVGAVMGVIRSVVTSVWRFVVAAVRGYITVYRTVIVTAFNVVRSVIGAVMGAIRTVVTGAWKGIVAIVRSAGASIVSVIKSIPGKILAIGGAFFNAGKAIIGKLVDGLKNAGGVISGIAGNVWSAVKGLINGAIGKINSALSFTINLPGPDIHVSSHIPYLARGTRNFRGGLAMVGERGPELVDLPRGSDVIPNNRIGDFAGGPGRGAMVYIEQLITRDDAAAAYAIRREQTKALSLMGAP